MNKLIVAILSLLILMSNAYAWDYPAVEKALSDAFPKLQFSSIDKTDIDGLYEIVTGDNILYFSPATGHILFGELWTKTGENLTAKRLVNSFPLDKAVKIGNGPKKVIEVSDPDCPYCRKASVFFKDRKDVTRYIFLHPLPMHPDAPKKIEYILCAEDGAAEYENVFINGVLDNGKYELKPGCKEKVKPIMEEHGIVAQKLKVNGTPTFWVNGVVVRGANFPLISELLGM